LLLVDHVPGDWAPGNFYVKSPIGISTSLAIATFMGDPRPRPGPPPLPRPGGVLLASGAGMLAEQFGPDRGQRYRLGQPFPPPSRGAFAGDEYRRSSAAGVVGLLVPLFLVGSRRPETAVWCP